MNVYLTRRSRALTLFVQPIRRRGGEKNFRSGPIISFVTEMPRNVRNAALIDSLAQYYREQKFSNAENFLKLCIVWFLVLFWLRGDVRNSYSLSFIVFHISRLSRKELPSSMFAFYFIILWSSKVGSQGKFLIMLEEPKVCFRQRFRSHFWIFPVRETFPLRISLTTLLNLHRIKRSLNGKRAL